MHIQTVGNKTYIHAEDKWHLFINDVLEAVHKNGDQFTYAMDRTLSKSMTASIQRFAEFNHSEVKYVGEKELRELATQHTYAIRKSDE